MHDEPNANLSNVLGQANVILQNCNIAILLLEYHGTQMAAAAGQAHGARKLATSIVKGERTRVEKQMLGGGLRALYR